MCLIKNPRAPNHYEIGPHQKQRSIKKVWGFQRPRGISERIVSVVDDVGRLSSFSLFILESPFLACEFL